MGFFCHFMGAVTYLFYEPILSPRLQIDLGVRADLTFAMMAVMYATGCVIIGKLSSFGDLRITIFICFFLSSISIFLSGGLSTNSVSMTLLGIAGVGFFYAGQIVPVYVEVINVMET